MLPLCMTSSNGELVTSKRGRERGKEQEIGERKKYMYAQFLCLVLFCVIHYFYSQRKPLSLQWFLVFSHLVYCRLNDRQCPVTDPSAPCISTRLPGKGGS